MSNRRGSRVIAAPSRRRRKRGTGTIYRRPGTAYWWMAVPYRGRMLRESTGETDKKKAQNKLKAKLDEVAAARGGYTTLVGPEQRQMTVKALLDALVQDYELRGVRSLKSVRSYIKKVEPTFGGWKAVEVTSEALDRYIGERIKAGDPPATVNRRTQLLGQALRPFLTKHRLPVPEIRTLPEENTREGFFTRTEVDALVAALPENLRDFARWAFVTGWRKGEIASLRWAAVDWDGRSLRLSWRKSKNKQARTMALVGELEEIIARRRVARTVTTKQGATLLSPLVFDRGEGPGKHRGQVAPVGDFDKVWVIACEAVGLPAGTKTPGGRIFHDFRRSSARNLRRAGVPENVCMAVTGHKTRSIFDRYSIVDDTDIAEALTRVQAHVNAQRDKKNVVPLKKTGEGTQ
jgi:integrase